MNLESGQIAKVRKELLGLMVLEHCRKKDYGIVIKVNSREKSTFFYKTRRFVNTPPKRPYFPTPEKAPHNDIELGDFEPKRVQTRKYCKTEWKKENKNDITNKAMESETSYLSKKEERKAGLKKIRTLALQLKGLRTIVKQTPNKNARCFPMKGREAADKSPERKKSHTKNKTLDFTSNFHKKHFAEDFTQKISSFIELPNLLITGIRLYINSRRDCGYY